MLRCNEVAELLAGPEKAPGGLRQWWALRMHLLFCDKCREYARGLGRLRGAVRALWAESGPDAERVERLRAEIRRAADGTTGLFK